MLLPGTTLVVSPLVALMEDQLAHLPPSLPGAALHSAQSPAAAAAALTALRGGALKILFLSPERFLSPRFRALISGLPPGAFPRMVVVDEAHCVSEWSHNFRPAYQRLGCAISALADLCCGGARPAVLAVTATATLRTEAHCADILGISRPGGVVRLGSVRNNLRLAVVRSTGDQRMPALLALLRPSAAAKKSQQLASAGVSVSRDFSSGRHDRGPLGIPRAQLGSFAQDLSKLESGSAIVYCGYRFEAERVAGYLFQNGVSAAAYHSGLKAEERAKVGCHFVVVLCGVSSAVVLCPCFSALPPLLFVCFFPSLYPAAELWERAGAVTLTLSGYLRVLVSSSGLWEYSPVFPPGSAPLHGWAAARRVRHRCVWYGLGQGTPRWLLSPHHHHRTTHAKISHVVFTHL